MADATVDVSALTCEKGDDTPCGEGNCCAYSKVMGVESYTCAPVAGMEMAASMVEAMDGEMYCAGAVATLASFAAAAVSATFML